MNSQFVIGHADKKPVKVDMFTLADTRGVICASSGAGKSWTLRLIVECVASSIQTIVIDPEGEFATLREKLDVLVVGESGDLRADVRSAGLLARRLAETGVSAVIDIYELPGTGDPWNKRRAFVAEFITALMNLPKSLYHPMLIIVDEAHNFAPEEARGEESLRSRSAINNLMSAGRKRGYGGILATQRISKIHKDSIADARNVFIGGTTLDVDQVRAGDMLGMNKADLPVSLGGRHAERKWSNHYFLKSAAVKLCFCQGKGCEKKSQAYQKKFTARADAWLLKARDELGMTFLAIGRTMKIGNEKLSGINKTRTNPTISYRYHHLKSLLASKKQSKRKQ